MSKKNKMGKRHGISIRPAVFFIFFWFSIVIIALLWIFRAFFFDEIYQNEMKGKMADAAEEVWENLDGYLDDKNDFDSKSYQYQIIFSIYQVQATRDEIYPITLYNAPLAAYARRDFTEEEFHYLLQCMYDSSMNDKHNCYYIVYEDSDVKNHEKSWLYYSYVGTKTVGNTTSEYMIVATCSLYPVEGFLSVLQKGFFWITIAVLAIAACLSFILSYAITHPLISIGKAARQIKDGEFNLSENPLYTETWDLADELENAAKEIKKTERYEKELIANVSHDLRTPLTMITGYTEIMIEMASERTSDNLQVIMDEAHRLTGLVDDLLLMSRYQAGESFESNNEIYDLTKDINDTIHRYQRMKRASGFNFNLKSCGPTYIEADRLKIMQVFCNLLNNAINYSGDGRDIDITCEQKDDHVVVKVKDHGIGIAQESLPYIFNRYYKEGRLHDRAKVGSGIGLSIVKRILDSYHADYGVESTINQGSTFWFSLPIVMMGVDVEPTEENSL